MWVSKLLIFQPPINILKNPQLFIKNTFAWKAFFVLYVNNARWIINVFSKVKSNSIHQYCFNFNLRKTLSMWMNFFVQHLRSVMDFCKLHKNVLTLRWRLSSPFLLVFSFYATKTKKWENQGFVTFNGWQLRTILVFFRQLPKMLHNFNWYECVV